MEEQNNIEEPLVRNDSGILGSCLPSEEMMSNGKSLDFFQASKVVLLGGSFNILLLCVPIAITSYFSKWPDAVTFIFSILSMAPLAERLGFITEQMAMHTNDTIGALLNVSFGNAPELIVACSALGRDLIRVIQLTLIGSVLSNILLVLGSSLILGGWNRKYQYFNSINSEVSPPVLMFAVMCFVLPTVLRETHRTTYLGKVNFSRVVSFAMLIAYFAFLYFQVFSEISFHSE
jgi:Ca2+:H+ antiporter